MGHVIDIELSQFKAIAAKGDFLPKDEEVGKLSFEDVMVAIVNNGMDDPVDGLFRTLYHVYFLLLLLPVSSATYERSFSALKIMKTRLLHAQRYLING